MENKVKKIREEVESFIVSSSEELEKFRISFLGSKGSVKGLFSELKNVAIEQKREAGQLVNGLREFVQNKFETIEQTIQSNKNALNSETKSSAGDKHETGRAMLQLEMEKAGQQLKEVQEMQLQLHKIIWGNKKGV